MVPYSHVVLICSSCALGLPYQQHLSQHHHQQPLHQTPRPQVKGSPPSALTRQRCLVRAIPQDTRITHLNYGTNENHCWRIECDRFVHLTWDTFETERGSDYVRIYRESGNGYFPLQRTLHGTSLPATMRHRGPLVVQFTSDGSVEGRGFDLQFVCSGSSIPTPVPTSSPATSAPDTEAPSKGVAEEGFPSQCTDETEVLGENSTRITHLNYGTNENHCWRIECDRFVHLTWVTFETERGSDYVRIYRESGNGYFPLRQTLHGTSLPATMRHRGPLVVQFTSDGSVEGRGFDLQFVCSGSSIPTTPVPTSSPATSAPDTDLSPMEAPSEGVEFPSQCTDETEVLGEGDTRITHLNYGNNENHCWHIECDSQREPLLAHRV
eukprot:TRINITY_DN547_c0_g1_i2.p1 TRINITY_DN547_c0_g1~~TRINITY_DN547_c0_g1_i2.p1  ORF type:complete len:412 (+),score=39.37 TRINITY_DN547_c0_g1_i2:99-1238(+)